MGNAVEAARILLVDDQPETLQALARLLRANGHDVHVAATAAEATRLADAGCCNILISDLTLPDKSGHELMRDLHARYGYKGIALTGDPAMRSEVASRAAGFSRHLTKPVRYSELLEAVAQVARPQSA